MKALYQKFRTYSFSQVLLGAILVVIAPMFVAGLFFVNASKKLKAFLIGLMILGIFGSYISNLEWKVFSSYYWFGSYLSNLVVANAILIIGQFVAGIMAKIGWNNYIDRSRSATYYLVASLIFTFSSYPVIDLNYRLKTHIIVDNENSISLLRLFGVVSAIGREHPSVDLKSFKDAINENGERTRVNTPYGAVNDLTLR